MTLRIDTQRQVVRYTALITLVSVASPLLVVGTILSLVPHMPRLGIMIGLAMAGLIPLMIAPPIAYASLMLLRVMTQTIDQVDRANRLDHLTGLLNRGHFLDRLRAAKMPGPLMIIDADHFKAINDQHGHVTGDAALVILAGAIAQTVGADGLVGRLGGEEFVVFLPSCTVDDGIVMAERICADIRNLDSTIEGAHVPLTVSIGGVMHAPAMLIGSSMKAADLLLYRAKANGRDRTEFQWQAGLRKVA